MIVFWIACAAVAVVALALLLRPARRRASPEHRALNITIYRDQLRELEADRAAGTLAAEDYERARRELERRLLEDVAQPETPETRQHSAQRGRRLVIASAVAIPLLAVGIYFVIGNPAAVVPPEKQIEDMVSRLATKLRSHPEDVEGWKMLGRSYAVMGRFKESVDAYMMAAKRSPRDAQLLVDLADVLGMAQGQSLAGEPEKLVLRALEIDSANLKALALAGTAAFERKDYARSAAYWERMLPLVPAGSEDVGVIKSNIAEARSLAGQGSSTASAKSSPKAASKASLKGTVKLAPQLAGTASPEDTVYIFARAEKGPPMPLAVLKKQVRDLPVTFALDDSMAMSPALRLSSQSKVVVGARISKSGSATPQPGDMQGFSSVVPADASGVSVTISSVIP